MPHRLHALDIARTRPESKPVEDMDDALFIGQRAVLWAKTNGCVNKMRKY